MPQAETVEFADGRISFPTNSRYGSALPSWIFRAFPPARLTPGPAFAAQAGERIGHPRKMSAETSLAKAQLVIRRIIASRDDRFSLVTQIAIEVGGDHRGVAAARPRPHLVDLAKRYKTSRTPIREALMLLEKEGLVDVRRGAGRA